MNKNKAVSYCRVSSKEQEETGYSLPSQEKLLIEYSGRRDKGFEIVKVFAIAESASGAKQRKIFSEMMNYMEKNHISILLCEKVDRLTRNMKEAVVANDWVDADPERQIHFVKQNLVIHKNAKSDEKFRWDIEIVLAKKFIANLSEEVKKGQKEKLAQGWLPTKPPIGYKTTGDKGHKIHVIDNEKVPFIKDMFELYSTGNYSTISLGKILFKKGLRNNNGSQVVKSRIYELLTDPFYYGAVRWNDIVYRGSHEPIISKSLFDKVQVILFRGIKNPQYRKHLPVFKAKISCSECEGLITWEIQKGHWYGHCNHYRQCSQRKCIRQEKVETQLFPLFDKVAPKSERVLKWLEKALKESHSEEVLSHTQKREHINLCLKRADQRIERAYLDKLDGNMDGVLCQKVIADATKEKEDLLEALKTLGDERTKYYEAGYAIHELASRATEIYRSEKATVEDRRLLLSYIFSNLSLNTGEIRPNYTLAFEFLKEWVPLLNITFELEQGGSTNGQKEYYNPLCPTLLGRAVSNAEKHIENKDFVLTEDGSLLLCRTHVLLPNHILEIDLTEIGNIAPLSRLERELEARKGGKEFFDWNVSGHLKGNSMYTDRLMLDSSGMFYLLNLNNSWNAIKHFEAYPLP